MPALAGDLRIELGMLPTGESARRVFAPEVIVLQVADFQLEVGGDVVACVECVRTPVRRWQVYVVHTSHHDLGYTDLPNNVLREQAGFLDDVLRFCDETDDWPEETRFRYTIEQAWSAVYWAGHRPADQFARLAQRLHEGRIELTALFGNETTELCGHEEQIRLAYPAGAAGAGRGAAGLRRVERHPRHILGAVRSVGRGGRALFRAHPARLLRVAAKTALHLG